MDKYIHQTGTPYDSDFNHIKHSGKFTLEEYQPTEIQSEALLDENPDLNVDFRAMLTREIRKGFITFLEIMSGTRVIQNSNSFFEVELPRRAIALVREYEEIIYGAERFPGTKPVKFMEFVTAQGYDRLEPTEGAVVLLAIDLYRVGYANIYSSIAAEYVQQQLDENQ